MKRISFFVSLVAILCFVSSCSDTSNNPSLNKKSLLQSALPWLTVEQITSQFDTSNVVGICQLQTYNGHQIDVETGASLGISSSTIVSFAFDYSRVPRDSALGEFSVNGQSAAINSEFRGTFNVPLNYLVSNSTNTLTKVADPWIGSVDTALTFLPKIELSNVVWGQNISRSQDFTLNFSGASGAYVTLFIASYDSSSAKTEGISMTFHNVNGGIVIPHTSLSALPVGRCNIFATSNEPRFINSSNGKRMCVMAVTEQSLGVHLVP